MWCNKSPGYWNESLFIVEINLNSLLIAIGTRSCGMKPGTFYKPERTKTGIKQEPERYKNEVESEIDETGILRIGTQNLR